MNLNIALRAALIRQPGGLLARPCALRATIDGSRTVDGQGPFQRILGPLLIEQDDAEHVFRAARVRDFVTAAQIFEVALARSYGANEVALTDINRLTLVRVEDSRHTERGRPG